VVDNDWDASLSSSPAGCKLPRCQQLQHNLLRLSTQRFCELLSSPERDAWVVSSLVLLVTEYSEVGSLKKGEIGNPISGHYQARCCKQPFWSSKSTLL
jgi:hypothetical protein